MARKTSKRPPKGWIRACIRGVKSAAKRARRRLRSPGGVCGNTWYHVMDDGQRRRAKRRFKN